jgi:hypothetical protein
MVGHQELAQLWTMVGHQEMMAFLNRVQVELLEVLEVRGRRGRRVLQDSPDCLELLLLQETLDQLGHLDLLALKVKMETRAPRVIVVNQGPLACLVLLGLLAEKVYREKRENRYLRNILMLFSPIPYNLLPIENLANDSGRTLVCAECGYPKGSPNTNS